DAYPAAPEVRPAWSHAWTGWVPSSGDERFPQFFVHNDTAQGPVTPGDRRATTWDSGDSSTGGATTPLIADIHVPTDLGPGTDGGRLSSSFLAFDSARRMDLTLEDLTHGGTDHQVVEAFHDGLYLRFAVRAGSDLRLTLSPLAGENAVLSAVFLDGLPSTGG